MPMKPTVRRSLGFVSAAQIWEGRMNGPLAAAAVLRNLRRELESFMGEFSIGLVPVVVVENKCPAEEVSYPRTAGGAIEYFAPPPPASTGVAGDPPSKRGR